MIPLYSKVPLVCGVLHLDPYTCCVLTNKKKEASRNTNTTKSEVHMQIDFSGLMKETTGGLEKESPVEQLVGTWPDLFII